MKSFQLEIITPEHTVFSGPVTSIVVPATAGRMGVLANHAAMVASLEPGSMKVVLADGSVHVYALGGGFLEVAQNEARVVADVGERADEIDEQRAVRAEERARQRLRERAADIDLARAEAALARAVARVRASRDARTYSMGGARERQHAPPNRATPQI